MAHRASRKAGAVRQANPPAKDDPKRPEICRSSCTAKAKRRAEASMATARASNSVAEPVTGCHQRHRSSGLHPLRSRDRAQTHDLDDESQAERDLRASSSLE